MTTHIRITIIAALLFLLPLFNQTARAEVCWGKICSGAVCCGGHGSCVAFNTCACDTGYTGKECNTATFCGSTSCSYTCGDRGVCLTSLNYSAIAAGTCSNASTGLTLSCNASTIYQTTCTLTAGTASDGATCTLNGYFGTLRAGATAADWIWTQTISFTLGPAGVCACNPGYTGSCCQTLASSLSAASMDFGSQPLGSNSPSRNMTFTNPTTLDSVTIAADGITLSGANPGDFALGGTCAGATLAVGGSCNVTVAFAPAAVGSRSATLSLVVTPPALPATTLTASLSGTGIIATDSIIIDPNTQARLYAGLDGGGIYSSSDSGANWSPATTQPSNLRIKALVIDKNDSTKLYAASYGGGVFKSTDSSATWNACATQPTNLNLLSLIIDGSGKLYAGSEAGMFVSGDGCGTWSAMSNGLP